MVIYATWESSTDREDFDLLQTFPIPLRLADELPALQPTNNKKKSTHPTLSRWKFNHSTPGAKNMPCRSATTCQCSEKVTWSNLFCTATVFVPRQAQAHLYFHYLHFKQQHIITLLTTKSQEFQYLQQLTKAQQ